MVSFGSALKSNCHPLFCNSIDCLCQNSTIIHSMQKGSSIFKVFKVESMHNSVCSLSLIYFTSGAIDEIFCVVRHAVFKLTSSRLFMDERASELRCTFTLAPRQKQFGCTWKAAFRIQLESSQCVNSSDLAGFNNMPFLSRSACAQELYGHLGSMSSKACVRIFWSYLSITVAIINLFVCPECEGYCGVYMLHIFVPADP